MNKRYGTSKEAAEKLVRDIKRKTRQHYSAEEKIGIVLAAELNVLRPQNVVFQQGKDEAACAALAYVAGTDPHLIGRRILRSG